MPDTHTLEAEALRAFWRTHRLRLLPVSRALYDELDRLVRADERRRLAETHGVVGLVEQYNALQAENGALRARLAARHALGGCPFCLDDPPQSVHIPARVWAFVAVVSLAAIAFNVWLMSAGK